MTDDLRDRIAAALEDCRDLIPEAQADAVMAVVQPEIENASSVGPTVGRLLDIVSNLANEYQILAKTIGADRRVPKELRQAALERAREILEQLPAAIDEAAGIERKESR